MLYPLWSKRPAVQARDKELPCYLLPEYFGIADLNIPGQDAVFLPPILFRIICLNACNQLRMSLVKRWLSN